MIDYKVFKYGDGGVSDFGWGCSYRNIQTIVSCYHKDSLTPPPTIEELLEFFQKNIHSPLKTDIWIEPYHIGFYLDSMGISGSSSHLLYIANRGDPSSVVKKTDPSFYEGKTTTDFRCVMDKIKIHFTHSELPIIIDDGVYSFCLVLAGPVVILLDPHPPKNNIREVSEDFIKNRDWMIYIP